MHALTMPTWTMSSDEFAILRWSLLYAQVCTSLSDDEATARLNTELPTGLDSCPWSLIVDLDVAPVQCGDNLRTHRHLFFGC